MSAGVCPWCCEVAPARAPKCPRCGEALGDRAQVLIWQAEETLPDPELEARLPGWPEDSLTRAVSDHFADYTPAQRRAIIDELRRRELTVPRPKVGGGRTPLDVIVTAIGVAITGLLALKALYSVLR